MDPTEREICPACGEAASLEARLCRFCGRSLLVSLRVERPVLDGRTRYQAARAVAALGPPAPSLVPAQEALTQAGRVLVEGATRAFAGRVTEVVTAAGGALRAQVEEPRRTRRAPWPWVAAVSALVAAAVLVSWVLRRGTTSAPVGATAAPASQPTAGLAPAAPAVLNLRQLALRGMPSTVALRCPSSVASGFFVAPELVLTNAHALCPAGQAMEVTFSDGQKQLASVSSSDEDLDLAVLRVPQAKAPPLPLGDVGTAAVGDMVAFIGSPMGLDFTVHEGMISSLSRSVRGLALIQLDAKVNPGNSGGPLLDDQGRVIGIVTMKHAQAEGIGLALPINYAYGGERPLLKPPANAAPSAGFDAMVTRARAERSEEAPEVATSEPEPLTGLVGASIDPYRNLMVHVLRAARSEPAFTMVTVKVWSGSDEICTLKGDVMQWHPIGEGGTALEVDKEALAWARKAAGGLNLYLGKTSLPWRICPQERMKPGIVLELQGADPRASKLLLR